jgi:trk system potassium uptake protein TrkH
LLALAVLSVVVLEVGFVGDITLHFTVFTAVLAGLFAGEHLINLARTPRKKDYLQLWGFHLTIGILAGLVTLALLLSPTLVEDSPRLFMLGHGFIQGGIALSLGLRALRHQAQITSIDVRPGWLFMGSFLLLIVIGTCLLKLPRAVVEGAHLSWLDALFTSTSAVCVTGLAVENTAQFFSPTGQVFILCLIQIGGLGIMTLTYYLSTLLFRGMSLHDRMVLGEMISEKHLAQVSTAVRFIVVFTLVAESIGAVLLFFALPSHLGTDERIFQAVFHTVSAFCNAGFSSFEGGLADPLLLGNTPFQLIICTLIVFGGLGTLVLRDLFSYTRHGLRRLRDPAHLRPRLRVHTRLVLTVTAILIFGGATALYLSEFVLHDGATNGGVSLTSLFHAITARTAGFNTVDTGAIGPLTVHLMVLLMIIGGSPGGTAGGVRTTVFAVAATHLFNLIRSSSDLILFRRRLPPTIGPKALAILVLTMGWLFLNFAVLRQLQPAVSDTRLVFELVSAFATVGLSMNLTHELTDAAKALLILNMFVGRIGLITVVSTLAPTSRKHSVQPPIEDIVLA